MMETDESIELNEVRGIYMNFLNQQINNSLGKIYINKINFELGKFEISIIKSDQKTSIQILVYPSLIYIRRYNSFDPMVIRK